MSKQISAVEWLYDQLEFDDSISMDDIEKIFEKAKEMEKEQMIKFGKIIANKWAMIPIPLKNIEDIYNETFKSE